MNWIFLRISFFGFCLSFAGLLVAAEKGQARKALWTVKESILNPESAYFDPASGKIFVSNVAGKPADKDGIGWISVISFGKDGKPRASKVVEGLNAPKGLRANKGVLYVTDIDEVVKIDINTSKILTKIKVPDAKFLNDVGVSADGRVFVSDTIASKIYVIENDFASVFVEGPEFESPNGLLVVGNQLYVASWGFITVPSTFGAKVPGHLYSLDLATKKRTQVGMKPLGNLDGLEQTKNGDFIVSDWVAGKVFRVSKSGKTALIVDGIRNTADIGLMGNIILVPSMSTDQVFAYRL